MIMAVFFQQVAGTSVGIVIGICILIILKRIVDGIWTRITNGTKKKTENDE